MEGGGVSRGAEEVDMGAGGEELGGGEWWEEGEGREQGKPEASKSRGES